MSEFDYKVKFWDPQKAFHKYGEEILKEIRTIGESGLYVLGPKLKQFEDEFAKFIGTKFAVGVNSGTDALYIALRSAGVSEGDKVITVSNTFIATIESIIRCGAEPILVDIGDDYLMDTTQLQDIFSKHRIKAILPVHLSGDVCNMEEIMRLAEENNCLVIEDAAQAFGATYKDNKVGSIGMAGCFSLYPAKILGVWGDGGMITTNDEALYQEALLLRDHYKFTQSGHYSGKMPDKVKWVGNSRLDDLQAAVGIIKLKYSQEILGRRKEVAQRYLNGLRTVPFVLPRYTENRVWQDFVIRIPGGQKELADFLDKKGIKVRGVGITPNHKIKGLGLEKYILPKNEDFVGEFLRLPMNPEIEDFEIDVVIQAIKSFYEKSSV